MLNKLIITTACAVAVEAGETSIDVEAAQMNYSGFRRAMRRMILAGERADHLKYNIQWKCMQPHDKPKSIPQDDEMRELLRDIDHDLKFAVRALEKIPSLSAPLRQEFDKHAKKVRTFRQERKIQGEDRLRCMPSFLDELRKDMKAFDETCRQFGGERNEINIFYEEEDEGAETLYVVTPDGRELQIAEPTPRAVLEHDMPELFNPEDRLIYDYELRASYRRFKDPKDEFGRNVPIRERRGNVERASSVIDCSVRVERDCRGCCFDELWKIVKCCFDD